MTPKQPSLPEENWVHMRPGVLTSCLASCRSPGWSCWHCYLETRCPSLFLLHREEPEPHSQPLAALQGARHADRVSEVPTRLRG